MSRELLEIAKRGFDAWLAGNVAELEQLLDPDVELLAVEPGPWDCHGRADVLGLLRNREQGIQPRGLADLIDCGETVVAVLAAEPESARPERPILVRFRGGRVVQMRQYETRADALAAAGATRA